jgi:TM2 domain-containing membrane protein YozV
MSRAEWQSLEATLPRSDKKRITAGLLCLIPGAGRLYLGYSAHGVLQLVTFLLCGVGLIWSWIDCFWILLGGEKFDGYGRVLQD